MLWVCFEWSGFLSGFCLVVRVLGLVVWVFCFVFYCDGLVLVDFGVLSLAIWLIC